MCTLLNRCHILISNNKICAYKILAVILLLEVSIWEIFVGTFWDVNVRKFTV